MPFKSKKQRRWMHANEPEMAEEWEKKEKQNEEDELGEKQLGEKKIMKITKRHLRRIIKEEVHKLFEGGVGLHPRRWNVFTDGEWQEITLTDEEKQAVDGLYDLGENTEDLVIQVLEQSRGMEIEDIEPTRTNWMEM